MSAEKESPVGGMGLFLRALLLCVVLDGVLLILLGAGLAGVGLVQMVLGS